MILFIILAAAYAVADLFAARYLYGVMRAKQIDHGHNVGDPVASFNQYERSAFMAGAFMLAFIWPLSLLCLALYHFMLTTPVRSQHELQAEADAMARRVKELEKELGIK